MKYIPVAILLLFIGCSSSIQYPAGGYDYPKHVAGKDTNFYFYPLRDRESKKDSFNDAFAYKTFSFFNEPNLSIKPNKKTVFRLWYDGWTQKTTIISLTPDTIIVKQAYPSAIYDYSEKNFTEIESMHLGLLRRYFPFEEAKTNVHSKHYLDSMIMIYPELLNPAYYRSLEEKKFLPKSDSSYFSTVYIPIAKDTFQHLVNLLNQSGFWTLPDKIKCEYPPNDGYGFLLEANTEKKYKLVMKGGCPDDTSNFCKACQKLVELAHMEKEIDLVWNESGSKDHKPVVVQDVQLQEIKDSPHKKKHRTPHR